MPLYSHNELVSDYFCRVYLLNWIEYLWENKQITHVGKLEPAIRSIATGALKIRTDLKIFFLGGGGVG